MTSGQITYDLRRLRVHGLIERIPRTHRYQVTDTGLRPQYSSPACTPASCAQARRAHRPAPPVPAQLRAADRAYRDALDELARRAGLAA